MHLKHGAMAMQLSRGHTFSGLEPVSPVRWGYQLPRDEIMTQSVTHTRGGGSQATVLGQNRFVLYPLSG
jgi:hypothetical protein